MSQPCHNWPDVSLNKVYILNRAEFQLISLREQSLGGKNEVLDSGRSTSSFRGLDGFTTQPQVF